MVVVDMAEAVLAEGEAFMVEVDTLVAIVAGTPEDSAAGILAVDTVLLLHLEDILVGTMVVTTEDTEGGTMVVIEVDTMVEDFTHIGDLD
jgi:hypothetical protein